jgi:L-ascorbate metabolism protein UlaG (beta-lactamase superfamily)
MKMLSIIMVLVVSTTLLAISCAQQSGLNKQGSPVHTSKNYQNGQFHNLVSTGLNTTDQSMIKTTIDFLRGDPKRTPSTPLPVVKNSISAELDQDSLRVTWLGHSTLLIEIDGMVILTDPMFSDRASPVSFAGPKRFATDLPFEIQDLPEIDVVLISHDHYDHLDYRTILSLQEKVALFYVPLGVGYHLRRWGIAERKIAELDWWEERVHGPLKIVATPARHFSGRSLTDRNKTLWASWSILGKNQRIFFGGDSGYFAGFKKICDAYGPFDITLLESGAYNEAWAEIHMMPEETIQAHIDLQGKVLLPIHWAKFNLALHPWKEPIQRLLTSAASRNVSVATPQIGESFNADGNYPQSRWWESQLNKDVDSDHRPTKSI